MKSRDIPGSERQQQKSLLDVVDINVEFGVVLADGVGAQVDAHVQSTLRSQHATRRPDLELTRRR